MGKLDAAAVANGPEDDVVDWDAIDWRQVQDDVRRLRQRIFTASKAGDLKKVRNLQKLMLRSRANALLSVRRVTEVNAGRTTAGVDGRIVLSGWEKAEMTGWLQRGETAKVFDALKPIDPAHAVRGQYTGYTGEPGVPPGSGTETLAAVRAEIDNWRWAGVPFFLRSGKNLAASRQVVTLGFHKPPLRMFPARRADTRYGRRNELTIDFADPGSITASFLAKEPGAQIRLGAAEMIFRYGDAFRAAHGLDGYERLLLDAMHADQSLFTGAEAVERLWDISAPILDNPPPSSHTPPAPGAPGQHSPTSPPPTAGTCQRRYLCLA